MGNVKFFISHSSDDEELVNEFIEFLRMGLDIKRSEIFCTAMNTAIPIGEEYIPFMRDKIVGCEQVVLLITENYLNRIFCLTELGAAWALNQNIIPIVVTPVTFSSLDNTPLKGIQMINLHKVADLHKFFSHLVNKGIVSVDTVGDFSKAMPNFLNKVNSKEKLFQQNLPIQMK